MKDTDRWLRGGSWFSGDSLCDTSFHGALPMTNRGVHCGFRVIKRRKL